MIIIIDEASVKLASFYYHDEIFKPQWKRAADMSSASDELHDEFQEKLPDELWEKLYVALPADESINDFQKTTIQESADNTAKANTGNLRIPKAPADCIWIVSDRQQKQIADSLGIASAKFHLRTYQRTPSCPKTEERYHSVRGRDIFSSAPLSFPLQ